MTNSQDTYQLTTIEFKRITCNGQLNLCLPFYWQQIHFFIDVTVETLPVDVLL